MKDKKKKSEPASEESPAPTSLVALSGHPPTAAQLALHVLDKTLDRALPPVVDDGLKPVIVAAGKEMGQTARTIFGLVNTLFTPVELANAWVQIERSRIIRGWQERAERIPPERHVEPPGRLVMTAVEAILLGEDDPDLSRLFAGLLATAMDAETARNAHPSFPEIIKQLTPEEARLVTALGKGGPFPLVTVLARTERGGFRPALRHFGVFLADGQCLDPERLSVCLDNLCRLRLIEIPDGAQYADDRLYWDLRQHPEVTSRIQMLKKEWPDRFRDVEVVQEALYVTDLGRRFYAACVSEEADFGDRFGQTQSDPRAVAEKAVSSFEQKLLRDLSRGR